MVKIGLQDNCTALQIQRLHMSLRNISGHTATPLAYKVILGRYHRRFDCRRGISRERH